MMLVSCGKKEKEPEITSTPAPTVEITPEPTPTPFPEPEMDECATKVTMDASPLDACMKDGKIYARLSDMCSCIGTEATHENGVFTLSWRLGSLSYSDTDGFLCSEGNDIYLNVEQFCIDAQIGTWMDEEENHLYCTPGMGDWVLPEGYNVAVMMYHQVGDLAIGLNNTIVHTDDMEEQIRYLLDNGYTPIWFEDLWNVENIEKPVILTFDDGMTDNYTELFPLIKKYNVKITIAPIKENPYQQEHIMTEAQIKEMSDSGLVMVESHTITHPYLSEKMKQDQYDEMWNSRVWITRLTGRQPSVIFYPYGDTTTYTVQLIDEENMYRFGVKMLGMRSYNTSDDRALVYRFFPEVDTDINTYASWLESTFPEG